MLIMFRAKNFASFKDDVVLDLRKTSYREHPNHVIKSGDFDLLKTVAIYGHNASGKSNLISAISHFMVFIISQFYYDHTQSQIILEYSTNAMKPFLLTQHVSKEMEFEIVFSNNDGDLYQYGYSLLGSKIATEWLYLNNELIFERKNNRLKLGANYNGILKEYNKLREDRLYIAILDYFVVDEELRNIVDSFKYYFGPKLKIHLEFIQESSIKMNTSNLKLNENWKNDWFRDKVTEYIRSIDVGIKKLILDEEVLINKRTDEKEKQIILRTVHNIYDDEGNVVGEEVFDLEQESSGTLRFISFIQEILEIIEEGGTFIVDELSSRLHPLLTKFIVDLFQSDMNVKAQLIFTTHDISLMNKDQFRRDEIVLIDKNERGVSSLYTLADLGVRQDASFNKDYIKGKYGAIPIFNDQFESKYGE